VDTGGRALGRHQGVHRYTVGQRKGLGLATGTPMYVLKLEPGDSRVVVGAREELGRRDLTASGVNWIAGAPPASPRTVTARIRHRHADAPATVDADSSGHASLTFQDPQFAITPGQAVVFYDGDEVLGGGWID
jgi:tRNA-specific 2-thiouridylase